VGTNLFKIGRGLDGVANAERAEVGKKREAVAV
jgi:hypothetical protein